MTSETSEALAFFLIVFGLIPAAIAGMKGRSFFLFWVFGMCAPPWALGYAIFMGRKIRCPACCERIWRGATVCPHCRTPVQPAEKPAISAPPPSWGTDARGDLAAEYWNRVERARRPTA